MPDQDDGPLLFGDHPFGDGHIVSKGGRGILHNADLIAVFRQEPVDARPAL
jgi:hypothetical protein